MFHTRYSLFKQVYSHRVGKAIEYMVCDILLEANEVFNFTECLNNPDDYLTLTDCVLKTIEISKEPRLEKARALLKRLRKRDLYKMAAESILPLAPNSVYKKVTPADIIKYKPAGSTLCEDDLGTCLFIILVVILLC